MSTVTTSHIELDERGVAWIDDTNVKVIEIVLDKLAHGSSAEEMHFQYPHLSLSQIYSALSFYHDQQEVFDAEIERQLAEYDRLAAASGDSPAQRRCAPRGNCSESQIVHGCPRAKGSHFRVAAARSGCPYGSRRWHDASPGRPTARPRDGVGTRPLLAGSRFARGSD